MIKRHYNQLPIDTDRREQRSSGARPYHFYGIDPKYILTGPSERLTYAAAYQMLATNQPPEDIEDYLQYQLNRRNRHYA